MWVVWQHWIIHACLIALYEGFIGRWCIKGRDACLGCWSSNSKGRVVFTWRTETLNSHWGIWICSLSSVFFIRYFSVAVFHILPPHPVDQIFSAAPSHSLVILVWIQRQHSSACLLSVDRDRCLLATAFWYRFNCIPIQNKRRISFGTLTLSPSYSND